MSSLLEELRDFQINRELTSLELANILGVEINTIASWFDNDSKPDAGERYRIIRLLDEYK